MEPFVGGLVLDDEKTAQTLLIEVKTSRSTEHGVSESSPKKRSKRNADDNADSAEQGVLTGSPSKRLKKKADKAGSAEQEVSTVQPDSSPCLQSCLRQGIMCGG